MLPRRSFPERVVAWCAIAGSVWEVVAISLARQLWNPAKMTFPQVLSATFVPSAIALTWLFVAVWRKPKELRSRGLLGLAAVISAVRLVALVHLGSVRDYSQEWIALEAMSVQPLDAIGKILHGVGISRGGRMPVVFGVICTGAGLLLIAALGLGIVQPFEMPSQGVHSSWNRASAAVSIAARCATVLYLVLLNARLSENARGGREVGQHAVMS